MRTFLLATVAALALSAGAAFADDAKSKSTSDCTTAADVAGYLKAQDATLGPVGPAKDLGRVENMFGTSPHHANNVQEALVTANGDTVGIVFFDAQGCAQDSIAPGAQIMAQVLAQ